MTNARLSEADNRGIRRAQRQRARATGRLPRVTCDECRDDHEHVLPIDARVLGPALRLLLCFAQNRYSGRRLARRSSPYVHVRAMAGQTTEAPHRRLPTGRSAAVTARPEARTPTPGTNLGHRRA